MDLHGRYRVAPIINAAGTYTPLGVSRSSSYVAETVAEALGQFFVIDELQARLSQTVSQMYGAEAAALTHCVAAGITLAVAATMTGRDETKIAALPHAHGMASRVVIPSAHVVNYGHPILTDIRLAGATPVQVGDREACDTEQLDAALAHPETTCLLLVSSRLTLGPRIDFDQAVAIAHKHGIPVIIDGAAQDIRLQELLRTGADIVLISAHKYLAAPTAGLMIGRADFVAACRAQERGIGRGMKASKEALCGVLAALEERAALDRDEWRDEQARKVAFFLDLIQAVPGLTASEWPDPSEAPFSRVVLQLDSPAQAAELTKTLADARPAIRVMEHAVARGQIVLELVPLTDSELRLVASRIADALSPD